MAERKKISRKALKKTGRKEHFFPEVKGLLLILAAIWSLLGVFGSEVGEAGRFVTGVFTYSFGLGAVVPIFFIAYVGWQYLYEGKRRPFTKKGLVIACFYIFLLALVTLFRVGEGQEFSTTKLANQGGLLGAVIAVTLRTVIGQVGAVLIVLAGIVISFIFLTGKSLGLGLHNAKDKAAPVVEAAKDKAEAKISQAQEQVKLWQEKRQSIYNQEKDPRYPVNIERIRNLEEEKKLEVLPEETSISFEEENVALSDNQHEFSEVEEVLEITEEVSVVAEEDVVTADVEVQPPEVESKVEEEEKPSVFSMERSRTESATQETETVAEDILEPESIPTFEGTEADTAEVSVSVEDATDTPKKTEVNYVYPPLDLLAPSPKREGVGVEVAKNARILEETLQSFGVSAKIINATQGPAVTRYELEPAPGVKVNKIVNLSDDIALKLAATDIRMEAPIPGKAAVGIEVPNKSVAAVHLRDVLDCDEFMKAKGGIPVGLGKDIAGKPIITDLAKMPHLLVAGSTGSGKSVCINTLISSILFSRKPDEVKLILIDPKMVELSNYNGVPHLMTPVVTDAKKAASVLRWAVKEMESRYRSFAASGVRDVKRYNELYPEKAMPLVVIIIDELADLMMVSPVDVEDSICRLAQMARAAGLHLVLATQRPSVDVITGTIKANVPSRVSFAVSSQIDSRTILDMAGAEKLLGKGDMLFNPIGANKPLRVQGAFISDDEVENLVEFMKKQGRPAYDENIVSAQEAAEELGEGNFFEDELLESAVDLVMDSGQASVSMLQRRFRIGYTRAARLVDTMEEMKIVGPNVGSKARDILMTHAEVKEKYFNHNE